MAGRTLPHYRAAMHQPPRPRSRLPVAALLQALADGATAQQLAQQYDVSTMTILRRVWNSYPSLKAHTLAQAVAQAMRKGMIQ